MQFIKIREILMLMHKGSYASGFLYNPDCEKILLQQHSSSLSSDWSLFENVYDEKDTAENVFTKNIHQVLHVQLNSVHPVYSYTNEVLGKNQDVFYAICHTTSFIPKKSYHVQWFSFKEILKLQLTDQIRHDIVVGQRVIEAAGRKARGEHTFQ